MILFEEALALVSEGEATVAEECTPRLTIPCSVVAGTVVMIRKRPLGLDMIP
jgi:hypothetical protein